MGTPQQEYTNTEDAASPTCVMKSAFITLVIDAHERRHVVTFDILCTFLHTLINKDVVIMLEYRLAELMLKVDS